MKSIPILIIALIIAIIVPHVCAENVTYSQEYYNLKNQTDAQLISYNTITSDSGTAASLWGIFSGVNYLVLDSQLNTIMLEKQNELITEQNTLLGKLLNQTYSVHYSYLSQYQYDSDKGVYTVKPNL